jgi:hypothetical protein
MPSMETGFPIGVVKVVREESCSNVDGGCQQSDAEERLSQATSNPHSTPCRRVEFVAIFDAPLRKPRELEWSLGGSPGRWATEIRRYLASDTRLLDHRSVTA